LNQYQPKMQFLNEGDELKSKRICRERSEPEEGIFAQKLAALDSLENFFCPLFIDFNYF